MQKRYRVLFFCAFLFIHNSFYAQNLACNASLTSEEASIIIPAESNLLLNNEPLPLGTRIQVYYEVDGEKRCAGETIWTGESAFINVVGNDETPPNVNGYINNEAYKFCFVLESGCIIQTVEPLFLNGDFFNDDGTYSVNEISVIQSLSGTYDFSANINILSPDTCNAATGALMAMTTNGQAPFSYLWSNDATTMVINDLLADETFSLTVLDANNCPSTAEISVPLFEGEAPTPGFNFEINGFIVDFTTMNLQNVNSVNWDFGDGNNSSLPNPNHFYDTEGDFTVCLTATNACGTNELCQDITIVACDITVLNMSNDASCGESNGDITLLPVGGTAPFNYSWSNGENTASISALEPGIYTVTINYGNNCTFESDEFLIESIEPPTAVTNSANTITCANTTSILDATSSEGDNLGFTWTNSSGEVVGNEAIIEVTSGDTYLLLVTDSNGCTSTSMATISQDTAAPTANAGMDIQLMCPDLSTVLSGEDSEGENLSYQWIDEATGASLGTSVSITVDTEGLFSLIVRNEENLCTDMDQVEVFSGISPLADAGADMELTCSVQSVTLGGPNSTVGNDIEYIWTGPNGFTSNTPNPEASVVGVYTLIVSNTANACTSISSVELTEAEEVFFISSVSNTDCMNPTGQIFLSVESGTPPFSYFIDGEATSDNIINSLAEGTYLVSVEDANGCDFFEVVDVFMADAPMIQLGENQSACVGEAISIEASNDLSLTYTWSTGESSSSITVLETGIYSLTVSNASNCTAEDEIQVDFVSEINLSIENTPFNTICAGDELQISLSGNGYNQLEWSDSSNSLDAESNNPIAFASPLETTNYSVIASNECFSDTTAFTVDVFPPFTIVAEDVSVFTGNDANLTASGGVSYFWTDFPQETIISCTNCANPTISNVVDDLELTLIVMDENACIQMEEVKVFAEENPTLFIFPVNIITPNGDGKNDLLVFKELDQFPNNTLRVYNRWGQIVFDALDYKNDWNGTKNGKELPAGNYYYVLTINEIQFNLKSNLIIARN